MPPVEDFEIDSRQRGCEIQMELPNVQFGHFYVIPSFSITGATRLLLPGDQ